MKALVIEAPGDARMIQVKKPKPGRTDVLSRVIYSGICGTDLAIYSGNTDFVRKGMVRFPVRIGHEWSGIVEEVGEDVKNFRPGDRVVSDTGVTCGVCGHCLRGEYDLCKNTRSLGTINDCWDGSFAEYILMPERHMHRLPDTVALDDAALVEPASIALSAVRRADITPESSVLVIGTGAIGLAAAALCKYFGAGLVIVSGRKEQKLEVARAVGADETVNAVREDVVKFVKEKTGGRGVRTVIETSGNIGVMPQCINAAARGALIALVGFFESELNHFDIDAFTMKSLRMRGVMGEFGTAQQVVDILKTGKLNLHPLITHLFSFDEAVGAFQTARDRNETKIKMLVQIQKP